MSLRFEEIWIVPMKTANCTVLDLMNSLSIHSPSTDYFHKQSSGNKILKWREWWVATWLTQAVDFWICALTAEPADRVTCSPSSTRLIVFTLSHTDKLLPPSTPSTRLCTTNYILRKHIDPNMVVHLSTFSLKLCSVEDLKMLTSSKSIWKITWSVI